MNESVARVHLRRVTVSCVIGLGLALPLAGCQWVDDGWDGLARLTDGPQTLDTATDQARAAAAASVDQGRRHREQGDLDQALLWFHRALEEDTRHLDAHLGIADIYHVRGDYAAAAGRYETARRLDPSSYRATYNLGLMHHLLGRTSEAVRSYLAAIALRPDSYEANFNLATAYLQMDQPGEALPYARRAVELEPTTQASYVNLGAVYAALGRHGEAIEAYREAERHGPHSTQLATNLVNALVRTRQYEEAAAVLEEAIENEPRSRYYERLGYVHFRLGNYDRSLEGYDTALQMNGEDTAALNGLGVNLMTRYIRGDRQDHALRDRAIASWRRSLAIRSDQPRIVDLIARYRSL